MRASQLSAAISGARQRNAVQRAGDRHRAGRCKRPDFIRNLSGKYKIPSVSMADLLKKNAGWGKMGSKKYSKAEVESGELADDQTADLLMPNDCCWMMHNPGLLWTGSAGGGIRNWVCTSGNRSMLHVFMSAGNRSAFQQLWYMAGCAANIGRMPSQYGRKAPYPCVCFNMGAVRVDDPDPTPIRRLARDAKHIHGWPRMQDGPMEVWLLNIFGGSHEPRGNFSQKV